MNKSEIVKEFYDTHPSADERSEVWFDKWSYIMDIVKSWDDECMESEYEDICEFLNGEKYLLQWYNNIEHPADKDDWLCCEECGTNFLSSNPCGDPRNEDKVVCSDCWTTIDDKLYHEEQDHKAMGRTK